MRVTLMCESSVHDCHALVIFKSFRISLVGCLKIWEIFVTIPFLAQLLLSPAMMLESGGHVSVLGACFCAVSLIVAANGSTRGGRDMGSRILVFRREKGRRRE